MVVHSHNGFFVYEIPFSVPNQEKIKEGILKLTKIFRPGEKTRKDVIARYEKISGEKYVGSQGPGIQCDLKWSNNQYVSGIQSKLSDKVLEFHNSSFGNKGEETFGSFWTFISYPENLDAKYHTHHVFHPAEDHLVTTWTVTYYLQLPDNCKEDEGKLLFSHNADDSNALKLFPKRDTLYIFSGGLKHKPNVAPNSTQARIVLAGNVYIPFLNKSTI